MLNCWYIKYLVYYRGLVS